VCERGGRVIKASGGEEWWVPRQMCFAVKVLEEREGGIMKVEKLYVGIEGCK
jgi:hypothetical protein